MNENGIHYETNHFLVLHIETPCGEFFWDHHKGAIVGASYQNIHCPLLNPFRPPFGKRENATMPAWFEQRAFSKERVDIKYLLKSMGLKHWDAWDMFYYCHGHSDDDKLWVKFVGPELSLDQLEGIRAQYNRNPRLLEELEIDSSHQDT